MLVALRQAALRHAVPFDAALLALTAIAVANAKEVEDLEFTLYAPTRDGVGEAGLCGLFADWRVLNISLDKMTSTVLGVVQQVGHKIRTRQCGENQPAHQTENPAKPGLSHASEDNQ